MLKNIVVKKILINTVFSAASVVNRVIPKNDKQILLYSNEGFRDNVAYLYKHLIKHHYNQRYRIVCSTSDYKKYTSDAPENVRFVSTTKGILSFFSSGSVYYCFGRIPIVPSKKQTVVQMWHGTSFKGFDQTMQKTNSLKKQFYSYVFASSEFFVPIVQKKFAVPEERVYLCGHPRTDCFYDKKAPYDLSAYRKVIVWMPTFRKSEQLGYADTSTDNVVPFFKTEELSELEEFAAKHQILLLAKFHPMQDFTNVRLPAMRHVQLLSHEEFSKRYDLYELLGQSDALITDYSSVFYDYLLLDRPIAFTEDDEAEYSSTRGFAVENPDEFKPGARIHVKEDLFAFLQDVIDEKDAYKEKRSKINRLSNKFQDGKNCQRALAACKIH